MSSGSYNTAHQHSMKTCQKTLPSNGLTGVLLLFFLLMMIGRSSLWGDTKPDGKQMCQHENIPERLSYHHTHNKTRIAVCRDQDMQTLLFGLLSPYLSGSTKYFKWLFPTSLSHSASHGKLGGVIESSFAFGLPLFLLLLQDLHPLSQRHLWLYIRTRFLKTDREKQHESFDITKAVKFIQWKWRVTRDC